MNDELPIAQYKQQILETVAAHQVTIIIAETGAGKSTQVPQYLLDAGHDVVVTQPRRLAAATVAARVAEERGQRLGGEVGYRTARDGQDSRATRLLFCTDGLALVREMLGRQSRTVLVLDEVHEWNLNVEVLLAWAWKRIRGGEPLKLVVMSATLEADKLSAHLGGAPVVSVPGRCHPVEERAPKSRPREVAAWDEFLVADLRAEISALVVEGRNVLAFVPGKREIADVVEACSNLQAEVLPLHGELDLAEQRRCFATLSRPKVIVATNVAQTSITIPDVDAVVDAALEKRVEAYHGVEGLRLGHVSLADSAQRRGRAGRTRPGVYVCLASSDRPAHPTPEIQRARIDHAVLRLAAEGFDLGDLPLFHAPQPEEVAAAKRSLRHLGCLGPAGEVTEVGRAVARLPVGVAAGRMLVEAARRGVLEEALTVAACMEVGGIADVRDLDDRTGRPKWEAHATGAKSDPEAWLMLWAANGCSLRDVGLHGKRAAEAREVRKLLARSVQHLAVGSPTSADALSISVCAGLLDQVRSLTTRNRWGEALYGPECRRIGKESVVRGEPRLVAGRPFDVSSSRSGREVNLLTGVLPVEPAWLRELAPDRVELAHSTPRYDPERDELYAAEEWVFGEAMWRERAPSQDAAPLVEWVARRIEGDLAPAGFEALARAWAEACEADRLLGAQTHAVRARLDEAVAAALGGAKRLADAPKLAATAPLVPPDVLARLRAECPPTVEVLGAAREVQYGSAGPTVDLRGREVDWWRLPDQVLLPGGRPVRVCIDGEGWSGLSDTNLAELRRRKREEVHRRMLGEWSRPAVSRPGEIEVATVGEACGGHVVAYGVLDEHGEPRWSLSLEEAQGVLDAVSARGVRSQVAEFLGMLSGERYWRVGRMPDSTLAEVRAQLEAARVALEEQRAEEEARRAEEERAARERSERVAAVRRACGEEVGERTAEAVAAFAADAIEKVGLSEVRQLIAREAEAPYGRARRAASIAAELPSVQDHRGLDWAAGRDVDVLRRYLDSLAEREAPRPARPKAREAPGATQPATLEDLTRKFGGGRRNGR